VAAQVLARGQTAARELLSHLDIGFNRMK
jgi:hypothetical protein